MQPQLRVVDADPASQTFRADARLRLWGAAVCALVAIAFTTLGYGKSVAAVAAAFAAALFLLWSIFLVATFASRRAVRYTLSTNRIEIVIGILGQLYVSIE